MAKVKYYYDTKTLNYQRIEKTPWDRVKNIFIYLGASIFSGIIMIMIFFQFFDSPKQKQLKRDKLDLLNQYNTLNNELTDINLVLKDMQNRDDNIYRVIFEADPIPSSIRKAGFGGVNRYKHLENLSNSELIIETTKKIDIISKQIYIQSKSFDEVINLANNKANMLACLPSIQPVDNKDLKRMVSGFGRRIHPVYKTITHHDGMDFAAATGTPIYATANGTIEKSTYDRGGYGKHVIINHGFGYKTLYAHMNEIKASKGSAVKRGDVIGYVGNTGLSIGPHLHYEVHYKGKKENPSFYYHNDLSPSEYNKLIELSTVENQSFD
ncbi:MAG: M23 family metallopeptidase [Flavobacteriales bacterium]|jgi:murein DD-endopeptidase MepM/ murein hydrolase activator NlpD|nr:M23 family metallopeptidase [Flavobacteriales bacterium]